MSVVIEPNWSIDTRNSDTHGLSIWMRLAEVNAYARSCCALDSPIGLRRLGVKSKFAKGLNLGKVRPARKQISRQSPQTFC